MVVRVYVVSALLVVGAFRTGRADDTSPVLPDKAVGTFVGEVKASVTTRDKQHCRVSSEARLSVDIAANGIAKWRGYHRFEIACPGEDAPATSCWTEGVATVAADPKGALNFETLSTEKAAGPVPSDRHLWKCGHVEVSAPLDVDLSKDCVALGLDDNRQAEIGAELACDMGRDFPMLEKGKLTLDKRGQLTFPWDVGNKTVTLKRIATTPLDPPPTKLYDDFGCRFDAEHRKTVKPKDNTYGSPAAEDDPPGTVEEFCAKPTLRGELREGPDVVTLPDGNLRGRYVYNDGQLESGVSWWSNGQVRMVASNSGGRTVKTFFAKDGTKSEVEVNGRDVPLDSAPDPGVDVAALKRAPDLRRFPAEITSSLISPPLDAIEPDVRKCIRRAKASGVAEFRVTIAADGSVQDVEIERSPDNRVAECIARAVKSVTFPHTQTGGAFRYPVSILGKDGQTNEE